MEEDNKTISPHLPVCPSPCRKIAVYGGTFDPVHNGHISIAQNVSTLFDLDKVLFVPAFIAPHKRNAKSSSAWHRYAMLALATQNEDRFCLSSIELNAPENPFTIQTLSSLKNGWGDGVREFFIMGADSWRDIQTWHDWENLLLLTNHIIVTRPDYELSTNHVTEKVRERIIDVRGKDKEGVMETSEREVEPKIFITDAVEMDVSATEIRQSVRDGKEDWVNDVPDSVARYIKKYQLYRGI